MELTNTTRYYYETLGENAEITASLHDTRERTIELHFRMPLTLAELKEVPAAIERLIQMIEKTPGH